MKKLLVLILAINLIQTGFCQTGGLFTKESLIEMKKRELQKFVKPKLLRKLCSASIAEVAHGYLTHELRRKGEADVSTGLEIVLDIQKRQLAAARSKRMKRIVARPDS